MNTTVDPRPRFAAAGATALTVVAQVTPDDLDRPTPCDEFDVRTLLGHMLTVLRRPTLLALGEDSMTLPQAVTGIADDAWLSTFTADLADTFGAWADPTVLDQPMRLPWAEMPGRTMLPTYTSELTVHTWDLAQAIRADVVWNPEVIEESIVVSAKLLPSGQREGQTLPNGVAIPFANAVEVGGDAPALDRLIAWYGRNPA